MKIQLLPSSIDRDRAGALQYLTTYIINDVVAVDAGSLGLVGAPQEQARVRQVFLSHAHMDHVASLPLFLDNVYDFQAEPATIYASAEVWHDLRQCIFNNHLWPNVERFADGRSFLRAEVLQPGQSVVVEGLRITPVPVDHTVPTLGFIVQEGPTAVVIVSDTGPTDEIWQRANQLPQVAAVFLEVSYPDAMEELAKRAKHLRPTTFAQELRKLQRPTQVLAVHRKANYAPQIDQELMALALPGVELCQAGKTYVC